MLDRLWADSLTVNKAPIIGKDVIEIEVLGLAVEQGDILRWVNEDVFDKKVMSHYADPYVNLYNYPEDLERIKIRLQETNTRDGNSITLAKRVIKLDMGEVYNGKGRITRIDHCRVDVEAIGVTGKSRHIEFSPLSQAYRGERKYAVRPDEV